MFCTKCGSNNDAQVRLCRACGAHLPAIFTEAGVSRAEYSLTVVEYAGFWLRLVAYLIDVIVITVAYAVMFLMGMIMLGPTGEISEWAIALGSLLGALIGWLYYPLMESSSTQATLGKMAIGIVVTDLDGNKVSFGRATGRYFGKIISGLILNIGYIMAGFTERKQALHDMMASCLVVMKR